MEPEVPAPVALAGATAGFGVCWIAYFPFSIASMQIEILLANKPAAGKAGIASRLTIEHHWPGLPEPGR